jgi:alpha-1,6-mannosyltransferase
MRQDSTQADGSVALTSGSAGAGAAQPDGSAVLPKIAPFGARFRVAWPQLTLGPAAGRIALGAISLGALAVVLVASARRSPLVPHSGIAFPPWEAGPLHGLIGAPIRSATAINIGLSVVLVLMLLAYGAVLLAVRSLSKRTIVIWIVAMHVLLLLSPPFQLTDVFNYLGYARLGGVHHMNPYAHGMGVQFHDPIFRFTTWHHLRSPYGYLFTAITYPIAQLPIPVAYWVLKVLTVLLSLAFIWLVWKCAELLGRDGRFAVVFVAANPVYLMYAVAGFHNDFFMLVPSTAAVAALLAHRDKTAGAAVMVAVFVKFTAVLLLPFLLIAARPPQRRLRVLAGAAIAAVPLAAVSYALFGLTVPNLQDQSTLLTDFSVPNVLGVVLHIGGGTPLLLRIANVALVVTVLYFLRRRGDWIVAAGWSTLALVASLAWLVPWYVIWVLPLAALGTSVHLRRAAVAFSVYLVLAFMPGTAMFFAAHNINLMGTSAGQASKALQQKLAQ